MKAYVSLLALALCGAARAAQAQKDLAACKPASDAMLKTLTTTHHASSTQTQKGKNRASEAITVDNQTYIEYDGRWMRGLMSVAELVQLEKKNIDSSTVYTCRVTGDEVAGGQASTVYRVHTENRRAKYDSDVWIAKATGLVMRIEQDMDVDNVAAGKTHISTTYDYSNIKAPPGV